MKRLTRLKHLCAVGTLALTLSHSNSAHSAEIGVLDLDVSVGAGRQYSGLFGAQLSVGYQRVRAYAGAGFLIFSAGADLALTQHLSTGVYGYVGFASSIGAGGHLTYHFNSAFSKGFSVGVNVTNICDCDAREPDEPDYTETMLAVGYQF